MRRLAVLLCAIVLAGLIPAAHATATPTLQWRPCGNGLQCATVQVPLDYDAPDGKQISIALVKLPAKKDRIGSLFVNPGGPGGSGVQMVQLGGETLSSMVDGRFDIIGFDPRGVGASTPASCFATNSASTRFWFDVPIVPTTPEEERQLASAYQRYDARCAHRSGEIFAHMSSANAARDLDLLRQAVGDKQLTYAGYSYGSILGANYANLFPDKVRALYVDGVLDPQKWSGGTESATAPFTERIDSADGSAASLTAFLRACKDAGPRCAFSAGDPRAKYDALMARLRKAPIVDGDFVIRYGDLVASSVGAFYSPERWAVLAELLDSLYRVADVDAKKLGALKELYYNQQDAFVGVTCADSTNPPRSATWAKAAHDADKETPYFGSYWIWSGLACADWGTPDEDRYAGPWNRRTANPILVASNTVDPATPYSGAQALARKMPGARLLTVEGYGHTTTAAPSACAERHIRDYLVEQQLPPARARCSQDVKPFEPMPAKDTISLPF